MAKSKSELAKELEDLLDHLDEDPDISSNKSIEEVRAELQSMGIDTKPAQEKLERLMLLERHE